MTRDEAIRKVRRTEAWYVRFSSPVESKLRPFIPAAWPLIAGDHVAIPICSLVNVIWAKARVLTGGLTGFVADSPGFQQEYCILPCRDTGFWRIWLLELDGEIPRSTKYGQITSQVFAPDPVQQADPLTLNYTVS